MSEELSMTERIRTGIAIDRTDLDGELSQQAAKFLYVAEKSVIAEQQFRDYKVEMDGKVARLSVSIRAQLAEAGEKVTDKVVEAHLLKHPEYLAMQKKLNQYYAQKEVLKALRESYYTRKDCLIQLAISKRSEFSALHGTTVKETPAS